MTIESTTRQKWAVTYYSEEAEEISRVNFTNPVPIMPLTYLSFGGKQAALGVEGSALTATAAPRVTRHSSAATAFLPISEQKKTRNIGTSIMSYTMSTILKYHIIMLNFITV